MRRLALVPVLLAFVAAACGSTSPTTPSETGTSAPAPSGGLATIKGSVQSALNVSVAGTSLSTAVDGAGRFSLPNVPPGDVQLRFTGGGANAGLALAQVLPAQTVTIAVTVSGSSATLDSQMRSGAGTAEIEGRIQALPPTTAALTFTVAGRTVKTDGSTKFRRGSKTLGFADLKVGMKVEAKGQLSGDTLLATTVEIEDDDEPPPPVPQNEVELSGMVSGLTGSAASFQFNIGSRVVKGDATTTFKGDSNTAKSFADLKNGITVEVKGMQQTGFIQATRIEIEENENEPEDEAEVEGMVSGLKGTCPTLMFTVGTRPVTTSASTRFDDVTCATLKNNDRVEVKGTLQNGTLAAARVEKKH